MWLAFVYRALTQHERTPKLAAVIGVPLTAAIALNFSAFHNINHLVMLTHTYPFQSSSLYDEIREVGSQALRSGGAVIPVELKSSCLIVTRKFTRLFAASMGETWQTNPINRYFQKRSLTKEDLQDLFYVHFPQYKFDIQIASDGTGYGIPRVWVSPASGPPGSSVVVSGTGFKAHVAVDFFWEEAGGLRLGSVIADGSGDFADIPLELPFSPDATYKLFASSYTGLTSSTFSITTPPKASVGHDSASGTPKTKADDQAQ